MRPNVVLFNAVSIDGRVDWVKDCSEVMFTYYGITPHWNVDAIIIGSNTIEALGEHEDEATAIVSEKPEVCMPPRGAEHLVQNPKPLLVVVDSRGRLHNWRLLQKEPWWRDILVVCSRTTPYSYLSYLQKRQVEYLIAGNDRVDITNALEILKKNHGIDSMRIDSGGALNGIFLDNDLVDEINILFSPFLAGSCGSVTINTPPHGSAKKPARWHLKKVTELTEGYIWLSYARHN